MALEKQHYLGVMSQFLNDISFELIKPNLINIRLNINYLF